MANKTCIVVNASDINDQIGMAEQWRKTTKLQATRELNRMTIRVVNGQPVNRLTGPGTETGYKIKNRLTVYFVSTACYFHVC